MESYLCSSLNAVPLSAAAQRIISALRVQYVQKADRSRATWSDQGFGMAQQQDGEDRNVELHSGNSRDLNLNELAEHSNSSELEDMAIDKFALNLPIIERFVFDHADNIITPIGQHFTPSVQGEDSLQTFCLTSMGSPQARADVITQSEIHGRTFRKRKWIQPASPPEQDLVGCSQPETPPMKKFNFMLPIDNCQPAFGEEGKMIDIVDKRNNNGQPWLPEKENSDSVSEDRAAFIEVQLGSLRCISNVDMITSKCVLETSHYWEESRNCQLSVPMENSPDAKRCESISVFECQQDTANRSDKMMDSSREKVDNGTERRDITKLRTSSPQSDDNTVVMPVLEGEMECAASSSRNAMQHSIQPHSQAVEVTSFSKHAGKWEPPGPSQKALCKKTFRNPRFPIQLFHQVNGSMRLLKQRKAPQPMVKRQRRLLRPQKIFKSKRGKKQNKLTKTSDSSLSGSKESSHILSETDRKEDGTTTTLKGAFSLISDPRVCDTGRVSQEERECILEETGKAKAFVVTMVYQDGTTQLDSEQKLCPPVCGLLILLKSELNSEEPLERPPERVLYLRLEQTPAWAQQDFTQKQDAYAREMLLKIMCGTKTFVCFKAKDLLRTVLRHFRDLSWTQVLGCQVMDPQIAAWLLDPADSSSCFQTLLSKHYTHQFTPTTLQPVLEQAKVTQVISNLSLLHKLMEELHYKLRTQGLWQLYSGIEQKMIPVLAAMESYKMHVDKEALKKTSEMLGSKLKQLEQEAHQAAGQKFLVSSSAQLRLILFEKLRLHELCENKKLPKTVKQQQSTSETALLQLQKLHPLPKIILEYRQIHKIKTTFVDGILSCTRKTFISSTWNQTSTVSGRLSAKHPNFQALPKLPLQISKKQYIHGKASDIVTVHPRAMFIPREGWTFLSADFCQVELRLLAHLSADPQLLRIFQSPEADAFTMLAAQWKGVSEDRVSLEDREQAKRIVYSVVYGAGRERLSGILGVSAEEASRFQDSFLKTYREVPAFIQHTIQHCQSHGFVRSIMGRRRFLPHIHSADWSLRNQAERQAVNFVLQGSAADLAKLAMIRICSQVSSDSQTARLVAQIHDELLFEVEISQLDQFAALVKKTMESLQHIEYLNVNLSVPLKVLLSTGRSWGSMYEMNLSCTATATSA
ncbi:DNA polymerase nu [Danio rerio]|uniref:DNA-directed DNA polymerase n=1 Tax=Danio rerio TaxID=7955 RepID=A5X572_DANRE|nr:DNA polymerase nu [Danio rerio]ABG00195.1 DNA polymerase nu [Danio rerio]|eukprot:NP_001093496.1 DNA polymerase nu [Danio rerio]